MWAGIRPAKSCSPQKEQKHPLTRTKQATELQLLRDFITLGKEILINVGICSWAMLRTQSAQAAHTGVTMLRSKIRNGCWDRWAREKLFNSFIFAGKDEKQASKSGITLVLVDIKRTAGCHTCYTANPVPNNSKARLSRIQAVIVRRGLQENTFQAWQNILFLPAGWLNKLRWWIWCR